MTRFPILFALALVGCVTAPVESGPNVGGALTGLWGGRSVSLTLEKDVGRLEYDCAAGMIDGPLNPDADGRFTAKGTHTPGKGGPDVMGEEPVGYPARYSGTVRGKTMTLRVEVPARQLVLGPFELEKGVQGAVFRCL